MTSSKPTASRSVHPREGHGSAEHHRRAHASTSCRKCGTKVKKGDLCLSCQLAELQRAGWHL